MIRIIALAITFISIFNISAMQPKKRSYSQEATRSLAHSLKAANHFTQQDLIQKVKSALKKGADPNSITSYSDVPEHFGPSGEELLFEVGHEVKIQPLEEAVKLQNIELVKILLQAGANPNTKTFSTNTPILVEALNNPVIAELLITYGANATEAFSIISRKDETPTNLQIIDLLIKHGADINTYNTFNPPLIGAVTKGETQKTIRLLSAGADPNLATRDGRYDTPLMIATVKKDINAVRLLL